MTRDATQYSAGGGWWDMQWMRFHLNILECMNGFVKSTALPDPNQTTYTTHYQGVARSLFSWTATDGTPLLAVGTTTNYYLNAEGYVFDVTPAGLPGSQSSEVYGNGYGVVPYGMGGYSNSALAYGPPIDFSQRLWSQDNFGSDLVVCDKDVGDGIYYWAYSFAQLNPTPPVVGPPAVPQIPARPNKLVKLSTMTTLSPYVGRMVFIDQTRHVIVLGANQPPPATTTQDLMNVWWSDAENITNWDVTAGGKGIGESGAQRLSVGSAIISGRVTRLENLIWTDKALYSMKYTGMPYIYGFFLMAANISIAGMNATVDSGGAVFWMGQGEFYAYSGAVDVLPCPIRDYVFQNINYAYNQKFFGGLNRAYSEVWWFYCSSNVSEIDSYVVYNWVENIWYFGKIVRTAWLDPVVGRLPVATANGYLYNHEFGMSADGQNLDCYAESSDLDLTDGQHFVYCHRAVPDVQFMQPLGDTNPNPNPAVTVTVNFKKSPNSIPTKTVIAQYLKNGDIIYVRGRGRAASFRVESNTTGQFWRVGAMRFDVQPDGRR
jgi:hypothetical protein